jgi:hypothetical protein
MSALCISPYVEHPLFYFEMYQHMPQYGNEAGIGYMYSHASLIIRVPPTKQHDRKCAFDIAFSLTNDLYKGFRIRIVDKAFSMARGVW